MAKIITFEVAKRGTCQYRVELNSGENFLIGFSTTAPTEKEPDFSYALSNILNCYEKALCGDLFSFVSRELSRQRYEMPLYIMPDKNEERTRIGSKIRSIRQGRKMEAKQLAQLTDIDAANLSRIEQGKFSAGLDTLCKIATALNAYVDIIPNQDNLTFGKFSMQKKIWVLPIDDDFDPLYFVPRYGAFFIPNEDCPEFSIGDIVVCCSRRYKYDFIGLVGERSMSDISITDINQFKPYTREGYSYTKILCGGNIPLDYEICKRITAMCQSYFKKCPKKITELDYSSQK